MKVLAYACGATALYAASLVPFLLLVDADHLTPHWVRHPLTTLRGWVLTATALYLICLGGTHA